MDNNKNSALNELIVWCLTGDKPSTQSMLTKMSEGIVAFAVTIKISKWYWIKLLFLHQSYVQAYDKQYVPITGSLWEGFSSQGACDTESWSKNLQQLDCLFNSSFKQTTKKTSSLHITGLFGQESTVDQCKSLLALMSNFWELFFFIISGNLFNNLLRQTTKKTSSWNSALSVCEGDAQVTRAVSPQSDTCTKMWSLATWLFVK